MDKHKYETLKDAINRRFDTLNEVCHIMLVMLEMQREMLEAEHKRVNALTTRIKELEDLLRMQRDELV